MCNLYSLTPKRDHIGRFFRVGHNRMPAFEPQNAIFPNYHAPVVRRAADGEREIAIMNWGFVLPQPGRAPRRVTNVRDDTSCRLAFGATASSSDAFRRAKSEKPAITRQLQ